jgi:hypothetical protein
MQLIHRKSTLNEQQSNPSARESRGEKKKEKGKENQADVRLKGCLSF